MSRGGKIWEGSLTPKVRRFSAMGLVRSNEVESRRRVQGLQRKFGN